MDSWPARPAKQETASTSRFSFQSSFPPLRTSLTSRLPRKRRGRRCNQQPTAFFVDPGVDEAPARKHCLAFGHIFFAVDPDHDGGAAKGSDRDGFVYDLLQVRVGCPDPRQVFAFGHELAVFDVDECIVEDQVEGAVVIARFAYGPCALEGA